MPVTILRGNALALPIRDGCVDLVVTSPPYFGLRSYTDNGEHYEGQIGDEATPAEFVDALIAATKEMIRVLEPAGSIWVNLGDKYSQYEGARNGHGRSLTGDRVERGMPLTMPVSAPDLWGIRPKSLMGIPWRYALRCIDDLGLILRAEVIWSKPNGMPESVTDRVRRSHEQWFHFTTQPRYYSAVDEIRESYAPASIPRRGRGRDHVYEPPGQTRHNGLVDGSNPLGALPGSVWTIPTEPLHVPEHLGVDHYAAFPTEWPRRIIQGWSPQTGVVLDPFGGTGTTALVADALGRHGISVDLSGDYCRIAQWRTTDRREIAKAMRVDKPEPVPEAQLGLFA